MNKHDESIDRLFPDQEQIFHEIEEFCIYPHRRTGTKEGAASAEHVRKRFEEIGLQNVTVETAQSRCYEPLDYRLRLNGVNIPCFPINGTFHPEMFGEFETGNDLENAEIVFLGEGRASDFEGVDIKGKIVICECPWVDNDEETYAQEWCSEKAIIYDPNKEKRRKLRKPETYQPNAWPYNYIMAQDGGAAAFIGVLVDYFDDGIFWNEDYEDVGFAEGCECFSLPGVWVGVSVANQIKTLCGQGARADFYLKVRYVEGEARNVYGFLPGLSEETYLIHSHHDAVFTGAVQDASGMAEVISLAEYFSKLPFEKRAKTLMFAAFDGHYTDYAGHIAFANRHLSGDTKVTHDFVIEHIAKEVGITEDNQADIEECPEIRLMYVSNEENMLCAAKESVYEYDLERTIIMPVNPYEKPENGVYEFKNDEVISDAYYTHAAGIKIVSLLSPPVYLFHPMDTPEMVAMDQLVPVGKAFADIIQKLWQL